LDLDRLIAAGRPARGIQVVDGRSFGSTKFLTRDGGLN
jgi:hypothetical protein